MSNESLRLIDDIEYDLREFAKFRYEGFKNFYSFPSAMEQYEEIEKKVKSNFEKLIQRNNSKETTKEVIRGICERPEFLASLRDVIGSLKIIAFKNLDLEYLYTIIDEL